MKKLYPVIMLLLLGNVSVFAQSKSVPIQIVKDDPLDVPQFGFGLSGDGLVSGNNSISLGLGLSGRYTVNEKFSIYGHGFWSLLDQNTGGFNLEIINHDLAHPQQNVNVANNLRRTSMFDLTFTYAFFDNTFRKRTNKKVGETVVGSARTIYVTKLEYNNRSRFLARGGYILLDQSATLFRSPNDPGYFQTKSADKLYVDRIIFADVNYDAMSNEFITNVDFGSNWAVNTTTNILSLGLEYELSQNFVGITERFGLFRHQYVLRFYADALFGVTSVGDIRFFSSNPDATTREEVYSTEVKDYELVLGNEEGMLPISNFGFRVGFDYADNSPFKVGNDELKRGGRGMLFNLAYYGEIGVLPGVHNNWFVKAGIRLMMFN